MRERNTHTHTHTHTERETDIPTHFEHSRDPQEDRKREIIQKRERERVLDRQTDETIILVYPPLDYQCMQP